MDGKTERGALKREEVLEVMKAKGRLPLSEYVKCRVRYFCDGAVFGSCDFVNGVFQANRNRFGVKRTSGARRMRGVQDDLYSLRDLKLGVFG
jgi:putative transposase